jgi:biopolymer transport protein ExbB
MLPIPALRSTAAALITCALLILSVQPALAQPQVNTARTQPTSLDAVAAGPSGAAVAKEVVDNPYGLDALWQGGDVVAKGTLVILLIMSIGSWYIILTKLIEQYRLGRQADAAGKTFWSQGAVQQAVQTLDEKSAFHLVARTGTEATENHKGIDAYIDLNTWITLAIQGAIEQIQSRLQGGLAFLATVGSTAPFIGLFGTVWGIYHALTAIGIAGQASIDKVAGPVGEALIMTAIGLAVAVPAVLGYNWLIRRNKTALDRVRGFGVRLHAVLLGAAAANHHEHGNKPVHLVRVAV